MPVTEGNWPRRVSLPLMVKSRSETNCTFSAIKGREQTKVGFSTEWSVQSKQAGETPTADPVSTHAPTKARNRTPSTLTDEDDPKRKTGSNEGVPAKTGVAQTIRVGVTDSLVTLHWYCSGWPTGPKKT